jgi:hypothetical protein
MSNKKSKEKDIPNQYLGNKLSNNMAFNQLQDNLIGNDSKHTLTNFAVPDNFAKHIKNKSSYAKSIVSSNFTNQDYVPRNNFTTNNPHTSMFNSTDMIANNLQSGLARKINSSDDIINPIMLQKLLKEKLTKFGLSLSAISDQKIYQSINVCLETHVKNILENLIRISRIRQNNFEQFSKFVDKQNVSYF